MIVGGHLALRMDLKQIRLILQKYYKSGMLPVTIQDKLFLGEK
jgi:hypothetical protein